MNTLDFILTKYNVRGQKSPIEIRCSRLVSFPRLCKQLGFTIGAEIGVARGYFTQKLCQRIPNLKMYAIDAWALWDGATSGETQRKMDRLYQDAKQRLEPFHCEIIRDWSMNVVGRIADESLDFVYIDAGHDYKSVMDDISQWSKKVRSGGIVAGHDYIEPEAFTLGDYNHTNYDVKKAVDDFIQKNHIYPLFVFTKDTPNRSVENVKKALAPSWFYIKE